MTIAIKAARSVQSTLCEQ